MCESYYTKLEKEFPDVAKRYKQKLDIINGVDPFCLSDEMFSYNVKNFPKVTNMDIIAYLVLSKSYYTKQQMKAYKSLEAYKYFEAGFVSKCRCCKVGDYFVSAADVKHSQRMSEASLKLWIIINEDGSIECAHCTCIADAGEVCSHVGAVLFALEYIHREQETKSCTDVEATWNVPTVSKVNYERIRAINFGGIFLGSNISEIPPISQDQLSELLNKIVKGGSSSVITRVLEPWASEISQTPNVRTVANPFSNLYNEELEMLDLAELIAIGDALNVQISEEACLQIEANTKDQSSSVEWFQQRKGRITASNFKSACRTNAAKPSLPLIKNICYPPTI
ncbi:hypothetical protein NQ315_002565 [Exocentrus adspersus]|uniref:SWIM-type domain-containing protein n=1 Tax=Exocentrus adspersus TaxID=1586481 RepID=A0AAV8V8L7_9CUCU|nr:hypothetical protein NQ315_002565 [Exocentrus adspersus]